MPGRNHHFTLIFPTLCPMAAEIALLAGADLIMVDLERTGKKERQGPAHEFNMPSAQTLEALARVAGARLCLRLDSPAGEMERDLELALQLGASEIVIPMFRNLKDLERVKRGGAAEAGVRVTALVETRDALNLIDPIAEEGLAQIFHFGLRDLSIELGEEFMFSVLLHSGVRRALEEARDTGLPLRIGGIAPPGLGRVRSETLLALHCSLGSTGAFMSRDFGAGSSGQVNLSCEGTLAENILKHRECYDNLKIQLDRSPEFSRLWEEDFRRALKSLSSGDRE